MSRPAQDELSIELHAGPSDLLELGLEISLLDLFEHSGLAVTRWVPVSANPAASQAARPSAEKWLHVHLATEVMPAPSSVLRRFVNELATALPAVRGVRPELALSIVIDASSGRQRFALGLRDGPEDIAFAIRMASAAPREDAVVFGWDSKAGSGELSRVRPPLFGRQPSDGFERSIGGYLTRPDRRHRKLGKSTDARSGPGAGATLSRILSPTRQFRGDHSELR